MPADPASAAVQKDLVAGEVRSILTSTIRFVPFVSMCYHIQ